MNYGYGHYSPAALTLFCGGLDSNGFSSVIDTDGEFLLIEAANALPTWVKPEIMNHRVWINSGNLLLVAERNATTPITLKQALNRIRAPDKSEVQRLHLVEEEAFYRVFKYPSAARDNLHYALTKVPRLVALVLSERPQYISAAVEQFYLRNPISLKVYNRFVAHARSADILKGM